MAEPEPITVAGLVRRAVQVCDPSGEDAVLGDVLVRFEDADEPVTAVTDMATRIAEGTGAVDPEGDDPAVQMTWAVATYLAHRRDEMTDVREDILRMAARSEWQGTPPDHVTDWLARQGVTV